MRPVIALTEHLAPDTPGRMEAAARFRLEDAEALAEDDRRLPAVYLLGFVSEMVLSAAVFRASGFATSDVVDRETRRRRMAHARQQLGPDGQPLMSSDPHPIVGWARLLEWQRFSPVEPAIRMRNMLREAIRRAAVIYAHWRPELRYKTTDVSTKQLRVVRESAGWFVQQIGRL